jgi:hypothetical protein
VLLCASDTAASHPSLDMAVRFTRPVPVRDAARFRRDPWRSLFDCSAAARLLGWEPRHTWSRRGRGEAG